MTSGFRTYLKLGRDARKTVVALLGVLPLLCADATERGVPVVYVTSDSTSMSGASLDYRAFMILDSGVEFITWDDLGRALVGGYKAQKLCVLGDLDWGCGPITDPDTLAAIDAGISAIAWNRKSRAVFMHQVGQKAATDLAKFREL